MRLRRKLWATDELYECEFFLRGKFVEAGSWNTIFGQNRDIHLELGCGRAWFVTELASKYPDINFVGIDIKDEILIHAKHSAEEKLSEPLKNFRLVAQNIEQITDIFSARDNVKRIYINFCNPCFKNRLKKHRLTHPKQLELYKKLLSSGAEIHFKTDNDELYFDTKEYFTGSGFTIFKDEANYIPLSDENSPTSEHEQMFYKKGIPIKRIFAKLD